MTYEQAAPYLLGLGGLGVFWIILLIATKKHPWSLVIGTDGQPSTSKFQMMVWTAAVVFAFLAVYELRCAHGDFSGMPGLPQNVLLAMGISVATAVSAKSIAVKSQAKSDAKAQADAGVAAAAPVVAAVVAPVGDEGGVAAVVAVPAAAQVPPANPPQGGNSGIFNGDSGMPDLAKVQVVLWTFIAVGVFLAGVATLLQHPPVMVDAAGKTVFDLGKMTLPDIGQTLMILMGLGNASYVGAKIAAS